jgi:S1-C subfamily serine protease
VFADVRDMGAQEFHSCLPALPQGGDARWMRRHGRTAERREDASVTEQDQPHPAGAGDETPAESSSWAAGPTEPVTEPTAYPSAPSYGTGYPTAPGPVYGTYQSPYAPQGGAAYGTPPGGAPYGMPYAAPGGGSTATLPVQRRSGRFRIGVAGLVAGAVIGGGAGAGVVALADRPVSTTTSNGSTQSVVIKNPATATAATAAAAKAAPSVVTIYVANGSSSGSGSGVVLTDDGYVLTNNHVITLEGSGTGTVQVRTADGTLYNATVVGTDPSSDLGVVKLSNATNLTPATFADSTKVQVGDLAVAIGAPLGLSNTVTDGIVSATGRAVSTGSTQSDATVLDAIQTDAAINPGNSGGALVNGAGEVIGINTAIASVASSAPAPGQSAQSGNIGVGFAIPSRTANRIAQEIIKTGKASHALLGVSARTAEDSTNPSVGTGAGIVQVVAGGAAAKAGLQAGDVVTAVGRRPVTTSTELTAAVRSQSPGDTVNITYRRGSASRTVAVTLGSGS